jgi:hypothetical protein
MTDDAAFTPGSTSITPAGGVYQATPDTVDDGDGGALRMTQRRQLIVSHETPNGDSMIDDTNDALNVNVVAGSAGGTEYTEGDIDATIQGPAMLAEAPSDTVEPLQLSAALDLKVTLDSEVVAVDATGQGDVPITLAGEAVDISDDATRDLGKVDVADIDGFASVAGQKTKANSFPVTLASDEDALSVDDGGGSLTVDGSVGITGSLPAGTNNIGDVDIASALPAGTNNIGDVDIASALPAGTNVIGKVGLEPQSSGGLSIFRSIDLDESEEAVKASAGQVYGYYLYNNHATAKRYIKFYNATVATVVVGTTTPVLTIPLDAGQGANVSFEHGIAFSTAITVAATTGVADSDTGAPGVNEVIANIFYE